MTASPEAAGLQLWARVAEPDTAKPAMGKIVVGGAAIEPGAPRSGKIRILPLAPEHVADVARLHVMRLTRDFSGWAGQAIMGLFYRELIASRTPPPGFVALADERVVGFAVAVADARAIKRRVLVHHGWWLAALAAMQFVTRPVSLIGRIRRWLGRAKVERPANWIDPLQRCCPMPRIEFRGIVVDPAAHAPGVPLALMRARLQWAKQAGYRSIYFQIEPDNQHSIQLCQWAGAVPVPDDGGAALLRFYKVLT